MPQPRANASARCSHESSVTVLAAIDLGTNSFHLVVAKIRDDGSFEVLTREKDPVRLGSGSSDMKTLSSEAIDRGIVALTRMRHIADHANADAIIAVATSAVREADNQDEFVQRALNEAGIHVDVVSGVEEARLIHLGVVQSIPVADRQHLVFDIGGGSTEFIVAHATEPQLLRSMKVGAIRLTDRFFPDGRVTRNSVAKCRKYLDSFLGPLIGEITDLGFDVAIGSSGTIEQIGRLASLARGDGPVRSGSISFTASELVDVVEQLTDATTTEERMSINGLESRRADIIVGGAILLDEIVRLAKIETVVVSDFALREGIVLEHLRRERAHGADPFHRLGDLRRSSVMHVASRYHEDLAHAHHVTDLSLELFDELDSLHGLDDAARDLLEAAALLHNVGLYISHSAHHRHSYYIIRNSEHLAGFSEREVEIVAQVARYHRKSAPRSKHAEYAQLTDDDQRLVEWLSGLLRVAIGLDRSNRQVVNRVDAVYTDDSDGPITLTAVVPPGEDADIEVFTADARKSLLETASGRDIIIDQSVGPMLGQAVHPTNAAFGDPPVR
jgi:exopolyphosphatase / guanosine-5'-triphosphate,3'-diphosphate pyrophosphatase